MPQDKLHTVSTQSCPTDRYPRSPLRNAAKLVKKISLYDAIAEMLYMHYLDHEESKPVDNDLFTLRLCAGPPTENYCVKYKVRMIFNPVGKPKLTPAACDLLCPAGRSGCSYYVMAVIWKLDEMSRNNEMKNQCENDVPCSS